MEKGRRPNELSKFHLHTLQSLGPILTFRCHCSAPSCKGTGEEKQEQSREARKEGNKFWQTFSKITNPGGSAAIYILPGKSYHVTPYFNPLWHNQQNTAIGGERPLHSWSALPAADQQPLGTSLGLLPAQAAAASGMARSASSARLAPACS